MLLDTATFLVREKASLGAVLADTYVLLDGETGAQVGIARERPTLSFLRWLLRLNFLPTRIEIQASDSTAPLLTLHKRWSLRRGYFELMDESGRLLATLYTPWFSQLLFQVNGPAGLPMAEMGLHLGEITSLADLAGWRRALVDPSGRPIGTIEKEWAGAATELLTSADHYRVTVAPDVIGQRDKVAILLAACLVNDILRTEQR